LVFSNNWLVFSNNSRHYRFRNWHFLFDVSPALSQIQAVLSMIRLLPVAILIIGTLPLYAQAQQPNAAELAQWVVGVIAGNKTKTQTYCQVLDLSDELDQVDQKKEGKKAEDLSQKINELQKNLGPEYLALLEALKNVDPNSKDGHAARSGHCAAQRMPTKWDALCNANLFPSCEAKRRTRA